MRKGMPAASLRCRRMKSGSSGVGESHQAIMKGESGSMGSLSLRISAAKSTGGAFFGRAGGEPPVEGISTTCAVRSGPYPGDFWGLMLPRECLRNDVYHLRPADVRLRHAEFVQQQLDVVRKVEAGVAALRLARLSMSPD